MLRTCELQATHLNESWQRKLVPTRNFLSSFSTSGLYRLFKNSLLRLAVDARFAKEISDLNERTKKLKADFDYEERRRNDLDHQLREVKKSFGTFFEESAERVVKFTFDGMLANQLTDIAANWKKNDESEQYKEIVNILKETPHLEKSGNDLADYLVGKIQDFS